MRVTELLLQRAGLRRPNGLPVRVQRMGRRHLPALTVLEDLTIWSPKIRPGGFLAGHDYRLFSNKPMIEVVMAVQRFTTDHAIAPWFLLSSEPTPSFLWEIH